MNHKERMLQAIEKVIRQAQPSIALQAVEQLIAYPDEEQRIRAMITLTGNVPEEVDKKIKSYLQDYSEFIAQAKENHPGIAEKISKDIEFELKLYETLQTGSKPEDLEELVNNPNFKKCKNYPYVALNYALTTGKNNVVAESIDAMTSEQVWEVSGMVKSENPEFVYSIGKRLLKSNKKEVCERGICYVSKTLETDRVKAVELVQANLEKILRSEQGITLFDKVSEDIYSATEDKEELVSLALKKTPKTGINLARKLASEKKTFEEVLEVTSLVAETGDTKVIKEFLEESIKREETYSNLVEVINASLKYDIYHMDFVVHAHSLGSREELLSTGEEFLKKKNPATADLFLRKALESSTDYQDFKLIAEKMRKQDRDCALVYLRLGVRNTHSLSDFVDLFENSNHDYLTEVVIDGLRHHSKIDDYKFALEYLSDKSGVLDVLDAITEMRKQEMSKGAQKLLDTYETEKKEEIAKAEKEREEAEKAEKERKEEARRKRAEAEKRSEEERKRTADSIPYFGPKSGIEDPDQKARRFPNKDGTDPKPPKKSTPLIINSDESRGRIDSSLDNLLRESESRPDSSNLIIPPSYTISEKFSDEKKYSINKYIKNSEIIENNKIYEDKKRFYSD
ncbi:hypothetical protein HZA97_08840 [Candidatus Woesearchaeota archaeon]|nr:hypothetical protein [Candidatus Woesearchaeota archaeon]